LSVKGNKPLSSSILVAIGVQLMSKSGSKNKKKANSNRRLLVISIAFSALLILGSIAYKVLFQDKATKFSMKAAIVDQVSENYPNSTFCTTVTKLLNGDGFNVSYFNWENVTVPFYETLVEGDYGIIILRVHSAIRNGSSVLDFFTSEEYNQSKLAQYSKYSGLLDEAEYLVPLGQAQEPGKYYFAITPDFIERFGSFPKSIIITMGCSGLNVTSMAQAFIDKGAKAYVGWTNVVLPNDTDYETAKLLEMFLGKNETLANSVEFTSVHNYYDPEKGIRIFSRMESYPVSPSTDNLTISNLIAEAKNTKTQSSNIEQSSFLIAKEIVNKQKGETE
jgi:hypothetical protein